MPVVLRIPPRPCDDPLRPFSGPLTSPLLYFTLRDRQAILTANPRRLKRAARIYGENRGFLRVELRLVGLGELGTVPP